MTSLRRVASLFALLVIFGCASGPGGSGRETEEGEVEVQRDCSAVRCAACPPGQHPALQPPDCCRCVPD